MIEGRYCPLYATAFSPRLFFPSSLWLVKEIPGSLFLTVQLFQALLHVVFLYHHCVYSAAFRRDLLLSLPKSQRGLQERYKGRGVLSSCIPFLDQKGEGEDIPECRSLD